MPNIFILSIFSFNFCFNKRDFVGKELKLNRNVFITALNRLKLALESVLGLSHNCP